MATPDEVTTLRERSIVRCLRDWLKAKHPESFIMPEIDIMRTRADLTLSTRTVIEGFEVKADQDTFKRLPRQVPAYDRIFMRNWLVVGPKLSKKLTPETVPSHWGVIVAEVPEGSEKMVFRVAREAKKNPNVSKLALTYQLRTTELSAALKAQGNSHWKSKKAVKSTILCDSHSVEGLAGIVFSAYKARGNWRIPVVEGQIRDMKRAIDYCTRLIDAGAKNAQWCGMKLESCQKRLERLESNLEFQRNWQS